MLGNAGVAGFLKQPWDHQLQIFQKGKDLKNFAVFAEAGTGKTLATILLALNKASGSEPVYKTLVITPKITIKNWQLEWLDATHLNEQEVVAVLGTGAERIAIIKESRHARVLIASYESVIMPKVLAELMVWSPDILIVDESHKVKTPGASRTKKVFLLSQLSSVKHRYIMTGTPVLNSPMDLFSQYKILDGGETFGKNFDRFKNEYFVNLNAGTRFNYPDWKMKEGALSQITEKIKPTSVSLKKADCLKLPPLVRKKIFVELSPEQARLYKEMARDFVTYFQGRAVIAQMALTKLLRLMQIVSGFVQTEGENGNPGVLRSIEDNPRQAALSELLEEILPSGKVIVWANFRQNYEQIRQVCESLKVSYAQIHGEINEKDQFRAIDTFTKDPDCQVLIGSPGSLGCGVNLTVAPYSIFYSRSFSLEHSVQAEARTYRAGSEVHQRLTRYDLIAEGTVDEYISQKLANKEAISFDLLQDLALALRKFHGF